MDGFDPQHYEKLPNFATLHPPNVELDKRIKERESVLRDLTAESSTTNERVTVLTSHLKSVQEELSATQQLLDAKESELHGERHLAQLAEREAGRLRVESVNIDKDIDNVKDEINRVRNNIFKGNEKLDQYNLELNLNKEELEQWALAAKQKEDDHLALERYRRQDEARVKEHTLRIEKLEEQINLVKRQLDDEVTETQAAQIELDKTAEDFRRLHLERQQLIEQFNESILAMKRRDEAITVAKQQFEEQEAVLHEKARNVEEQAAFLEELKQENVDVENQTSKTERLIAKMREEFGQAQRSLTEFQDEVEVLKGLMSKAQADLVRRKREVEAMRKQLLRETRAAQKAERYNEAIRSTLIETQKRSGDLEHTAKELEAYHKLEESRLREAEKELEKLKRSTFKKSQELHAMRSHQKDLMMEISGTVAAVKNLQGTITGLDQKSLKQQEILYQQDFRIQDMERKVARASGERSNEEKQRLNAKIEELQKILDERVTLHSHLTAQLKKIEDDVRMKRRELTKLVEEKSGVNEKIDELLLETTSLERSLGRLEKIRAENMVKQNLLKLDLKNLRDHLNGKADEVFNLENHDSQLELAMEEKEREIVAHTDMLRAQLRLLETERSKVAMELNERVQKAQKLESKFDVLDKRLNGGTTDGGQPKSQTQVIIQAAQEKEELLRQGDELDSAISKIEKEIRHMSRMLDDMKGANEMMRRSNHLVDAGSRELDEKGSLEQRLMKAREQLRRKKIQRDASRQDFDQLMLNRRELEKDSAEIQDSIGELEAKRAQLEKDLGEKQERVRRNSKLLERLARDYKRKRSLAADQRSPDEEDFAAIELRELYSATLNTLTHFAATYPEIQGTLAKLFEREGIQPPSRPQSARSRTSARSAGSQQSQASRTSLTPAAAKVGL